MSSTRPRTDQLAVVTFAVYATGSVAAIARAARHASQPPHRGCASMAASNSRAKRFAYALAHGIRAAVAAACASTAAGRP
ncbi:hypothetical protein NPIL_312091 [Nephila pilipes]|uniref:Uncharacterized protein n=1 Tax=Nephila pilipes TaxID=299642 RepID=A0A8X6NPM4_NEPPI|nr:hypothetical protein NPIL_312091 [Nephila pilipes]